MNLLARHEHAWTLEKEMYGELPKLNTPVKQIMWGQVEICSTCPQDKPARRFKSKECLNRGGVGYAEEVK